MHTFHFYKCCQITFQNGCTTSHQLCTRISISLHSHKHTIWIDIFIFTNLVVEKRHLIFVFVCTSQIPNEIELKHFLICSLTMISLSHSEKCLFILFAHFSIGIFFIDCKFFIYILVLVGPFIPLLSFFPPFFFINKNHAHI